ncbi:MAG: HAMP domain-containing protein [Betaproteobacteria bacterium]|nr:HAMP domain-containing protein [Betaproteobacteria bacterium]
MSLLPRSLFGRLSLLLIAVTAIGFVAALLIFRYDRASLAERQFGDTRIVQLETLRAALSSLQSQDRPGFLRRLGREYGVLLLSVAERPVIGRPALGPRMMELQERLRARLGEDTELRLQASAEGPIVWIRLTAGDSAYWAGSTLPRADEELPTRVLIWSGIVLSVLLVAAYFFARRMNSPLRQLQDAVAAVGKGQTPPPLPESGPTEIAGLAKGFNRMTSNLKQMELDRALLLAGVSHDLRTPLARLRLVAEMAVHDESMKEGMVDDIEEMDRIINQFLDFARGEDNTPLAMHDLNALAEECAERYRRKGQTITFTPAPDLPLLPLRARSIERALVNLVDNAYRYGSPAVDIAIRRDGGKAVVEVADRGPGIPPSEVERLKQPFTRLDTARGSAAGGKLGSGLGLAIVDRVVTLHGGEFTLQLREGGGTLARIALPLPPMTRR